MAMNQTGIEVTAKIWLIFLYFATLLFKPVVEIDGQAQTGTWGTTFFPTSPGNHSVTVYWKAYWFIPSNKATTTVNVPEGQVAKVVYETSWFFLLPGKISVTA
ncbi:MAG: hypothetical protein QOF97_2368 [Acidimicrobiaceae bacterium]|jgi:hypothetical protein